MRWRAGGRPGPGMHARRQTGGAESCVKGVRDGGKARGRTVIAALPVADATIGSDPDRGGRMNRSLSGTIRRLPRDLPFLLPH